MVMSQSKSSSDASLLRLRARAELERRRRVEQDVSVDRTQEDPAEWARCHRRIRGEDFTLIPPLEAIYQDKSPQVVVVKAAQVFISEYCINLAFWTADTKQGRRGNVLYVFPAREQLGDFVRARVDAAIEESPYLQTRVRPRQGLLLGKPPDNVGLKRVGPGYLYFRGSNVEAGLISVDADLVIYDEVDRLRAGTLALGGKRLGSSLLGWQRYVSTPTFPEIGIDALWLRSDRRRYYLKCEHCGERQPVEFPTNVREDGTVICRRCHDSLDRLGVGRWEPENPGAELRGYQMTKLLSPRADIKALATLGYRIMRREATDQSTIQEFYNQDLGLPHAPEGGQLGRAEIAACLGEYSLGEWAPTGAVMGVDVGARLHVRVNAPGPEGKQRAAYIGSVPDFSDLDGLMRRFDVAVCVVDALPEGHAARAFQARFPGRVWLCQYPNTAAWTHKESVVWNQVEGIVNAHRTLTLDDTFARIRERRLELPREALAIPEYAEHLMAPVRILERNNAGTLVAKYVEGGKSDHFAHAENYVGIAAMRWGAAPIGASSERDDRPRGRAGTIWR